MLDVLVSVILVARNAERDIPATLRRVAGLLDGCVTDHEIVIVDNASTDNTVGVLEDLVGELPNLQVFCLSAPCSLDLALVCGMEQAIGDYVILLDPTRDDVAMIPRMIAEAVAGNDIVLVGRRVGRAGDGLVYQALSAAFVHIFRWFYDLDLRIDASRYRLMSRRVVSYILQHQVAFLIHRVVPVLAGFRRVVLEAPPPRAGAGVVRASVRDGVRRAFGLILSVSALPMRLMSLACLLGTVLSLAYSLYVVVVYFVNSNVMPGWTTLSLQMSGMFFLMSLALWVMSEYVVRISVFVVQRPLYHVAREFRSGVMVRRQRLNVLARRGRGGADSDRLEAVPAHAEAADTPCRSAD